MVVTGGKQGPEVVSTAKSLLHKLVSRLNGDGQVTTVERVSTRYIRTVAKCGTGWYKADNVEKGSAPGWEYLVKDVKKICGSVVQRFSFDHCGAPGYNIAVGHRCLRLNAGS
jgi:hypothetical protein